MLIVMAVSCKKVEPVKPTEENVLTGLTLVKTFSNETHKIDLYTTSGKIEQGYNKIYFQVKGNDGVALKGVQSSWKTLMHMTSMSHSSPYSAISVSEKGETVYEGYIIFQMASNDTEYWEITFDYTVNGTAYTVTDRVDVKAQVKRRVESFKGTDNVRYIIAYVEPTTPKVGVNSIQAYLYKMENMMLFTPVDGYTIKMDPRMPGMGNHSSPNNEHLTQSTASKIYTGKLNLTMTGYWKLNLQLLNAAQEVLKGEAIEGEVEASSIYFEVEF